MRQLRIAKSITNREIASLDKYLQEINKLDLISAEEEVLLAQKIKAADEKALEKLTKANLRFVVSVAKQYQNQGLSLPDLINEGNLGLIRAAQDFDETRGFKFVSYAVWWIRQGILQAIAEESRIVRVPINQIGVLNKIKKISAQLEQTYERIPSVGEIAFALEMPVEKIEEALLIRNKSISTDAPFDPNDPDSTWINNNENPEAVPIDHLLLLEDFKKDLERCFNFLIGKKLIKKDVKRNIRIVKCFYGIGMDDSMSYYQIGKKFDLDPERVRQIKAQTVESLKMFTSLKQYWEVL